MINKQKINELAVKNQTSEINIAREYCQHLFLSCFYQWGSAGKVLFKGGTALRIVYGSVRFSEDLDFSGSGIRVKEIEDLLIATMSEISKTGIKIRLEEAKETSGGYLAILKFEFNGFKVGIQMEVSLRKKANEGEVALISNDFIPAYTLVGLSPDELVCEKIEALMTRRKPRDFFDLYFMLRSSMISPDRKGKLKQILKEKNMFKMDFRKELKVFLPLSHQKLLKDFGKILENEIKKSA